MRYYQIRPQRRTPLFRGFRTASKWLDVMQPETTGVLRLRGPGAAAVRPALRDRTGAALPCTLGPAEPTEEDAPLLALPEDRYALITISFAFPGPEPVTVIDSRDGSPIAVLEPFIVYPEFLFTQLQEALASGFVTDEKINFIETGTLFTHTTLHASYWFDRVITIELAKDLHAMAVKHMAHRRNVTCLQGNSADRLPEVIADLSGPSFFFLDAHWSGDSSVDWDNSAFRGFPVETARIDDPSLSEAERQVPLLRELEQITEGHAERAVIIIDDWDLSGQTDLSFVGEDWSHIDPDKLIDWMDTHPRTVKHFQADRKRYVWQIKAQ